MITTTAFNQPKFVCSAPCQVHACIARHCNNF